MDEHRNLPAKLASQELAATTEKRGSLVARGLAAVQGNELAHNALKELRPGSIDEETYRKAKPLFEAVFQKFHEAGVTLKDFIRFLLENYDIGIKPYIARFLLEKRLSVNLNEKAIPKQAKAKRDCPAKKELCFNLWYYLDPQQNITAVAAHTYFLDGSDDEKASVLLNHSREDYRSTSIREINPVHYSMLKHLGVEEFFSPEFDQIRRELPQGASLPEEKLYYATPLFDFGEGFIPAEIGEGFIMEREAAGEQGHLVYQFGDK